MMKVIFIVACLLSIVSCTKEEEEYFPEEQKVEVSYHSFQAPFGNSDYNTVKTK